MPLWDNAPPGTDVVWSLGLLLLYGLNLRLSLRTCRALKVGNVPIEKALSLCEILYVSLRSFQRWFS